MTDTQAGLLPCKDDVTRISVMSLSSKMTFGKYKGQTVADVIVASPEYIRWALNNVKWFKLDEEAAKAIERAPKRIYYFEGDPADEEGSDDDCGQGFGWGTGLDGGW